MHFEYDDVIRIELWLCNINQYTWIESNDYKQWI